MIKPTVWRENLMRIDEIEFANAMSSGLSAHRVISNIMDQKSVARSVMLIDRLRENESPSIEMEPGSVCWQISPYGSPLTMMYDQSQTKGKKKVNIPLHTFQIFSNPLDPSRMKDVDEAANHLLKCESISFLSLISSMVGSKWDDVISSKSDAGFSVRNGVHNMASSGNIPHALICDRSSFNSSIRMMSEFSNENIVINGTSTPVSMLRIGNNKIRVFSYDVVGPDGGVIFICPKMMGRLSQCGDIKFWVDQAGVTGLFSIRMSMVMMSRKIFCAIKRKE